MMKTRLKEEQMVTILRQAAQDSVVEVTKQHGASVGTTYGWQQRYGKLEAIDIKHLRRLKRENARMKKLLAERDLELEVMREISRNKL